MAMLDEQRSATVAPQEVGDLQRVEEESKVKEWTKRHSIVIPHRFLGFPRRYHPDFLVTYKDGSRELHETKGILLLVWLSTKLKRQSAEEICVSNG